MQEPRANSYDTKLKSHTGHTGARKTLQHPCSCNVPETIIYFPFTEVFFRLTCNKQIHTFCQTYWSTDFEVHILRIVDGNAYFLD